MAGAQSIFDILATAAGHPINRAGLNLQVAEAQAANGYRDAETQDALQRARMARDQADTYEKEQNAVDHLSSSLTDVFGDPDIARGAAEALFNKGQNGLKDFYEGLNEHDVYTLGQRYMSAPANMKPVILQAGLAANAPWAVAEYKREVEAPQQAATLAETQARTNLINQQAEAAKNKVTGQLTPGQIEMGAYLATKFGIDQIRNLAGFGGQQARNAIEQQMAQWNADGTAQRIQSGDYAMPAYDNMFLANQRAIAGQHGLNASAQATASGKLGANINTISTVANHLEQLRVSINALQNGDSQLLNRLGNELHLQFGADSQANARLAAETVGGEYGNIYLPNGGTGPERQGFIDNFTTNVLAKGQADTNINSAIGFMRGKMEGNEQQWLAPQLVSHMQANPGADPSQVMADLQHTFRTQIVNDQTAQHVLYGAPVTTYSVPPVQETFPGAPSATASPPGGAAPTSPAASGSPAGAPPRLTQTPPGTPGGTPAGSAPGPQAAPAGGAPAQPQLSPGQHPPGHQGLPTVGPHGFAPPPSMLRQATDANDPGINHLSNGEVWSWRAGDVPRYVGVMPVPTPGQGVTQTPNMPTGAPPNGQ